METEEPVLHHGDRHAGGVAVNDRHEDDDRRGAHQQRDQPFLEVIENLQHVPSQCASTHNVKTPLQPMCSAVALRLVSAKRAALRGASQGLKPVCLYTSWITSLPMRLSISRWTGSSAFFHAAL